MTNKDLIGWLVGRKRICAYCGGISWDTVKALHKSHGLPLLALPTGRPAALPEELDRWLVRNGQKTNRMAPRTNDRG